jgi:hypothetical protein
MTPSTSQISSRTPGKRVSLGPLMVAVLIVWMGGCKTTQPTEGGRGPVATRSEAGSTLQKVVRSYDSGKFADAYAGAVRLLGTSSGRQADEARYMAGMSAFRLGQDADAIRHLSPLRRHANPRIAGTSNITLGLIYNKQRRYESARACLATAIPLARGEDLARSHYHHGLALEGLGRSPSAKIHYRLAIQHSAIVSFRTMVQRKLGGATSTGPAPTAAKFTLQFGAYSTRSRAISRQKQVNRLLAPGRYGSSRVVQRAVANGRSLWIVQGGGFATRGAAASARSRIGSKDSTIVPYTH